MCGRERERACRYKSKYLQDSKLQSDYRELLVTHKLENIKIHNRKHASDHSESYFDTKKRFYQFCDALAYSTGGTNYDELST